VDLGNQKNGGFHLIGEKRGNGDSQYAITERWQSA